MRLLSYGLLANLLLWCGRAEAAFGFSGSDTIWGIQANGLVAVGDVTGDGRDDLVALGNDQVYVYAQGADASFGFSLTGLQMPGATVPIDINVQATSVGELDDALLELVLSLVKAQADAPGAPAAIAALGGLLGLVDLVRTESVEAAIRDRVAGDFIELNIRALHQGFALGRPHRR